LRHGAPQRLLPLPPRTGAGRLRLVGLSASASTIFPDRRRGRCTRASPTSTTLGPTPCSSSTRTGPEEVGPRCSDYRSNFTPWPCRPSHGASSPPRALRRRRHLAARGRFSRRGGATRRASCAWQGARRGGAGLLLQGHLRREWRFAPAPLRIDPATSWIRRRSRAAAALGGRGWTGRSAARSGPTGRRSRPLLRDPRLLHPRGLEHAHRHVGWRARRPHAPHRGPVDLREAPRPRLRRDAKLLHATVVIPEGALDRVSAGCATA